MAAATIPQTMKAFITQADKTGAVKDWPVPQIDDDEILVEVIAVALNPTDWKFVKNITNVDTICGCDWSGYVVKIGKDVTNFAVGDHAAGFTIGANWNDRGAFAEYLKTPAELAWKVPAGTVSHEEAASMGCGFWTAIQALYHPTRLGLVEPPEKTSKGEWIMIYGGSGSVGQYAIQLAHLSGYKVVATASPRNHELCKSLGADAVFDYKDPEMVQKIKAATEDSIHFAFDAISEPSTQKLTVESLGPGAGKVIVILYPSEEVERSRPDITVQHTLTYTALGRSFAHGEKMQPASPEDRAQMAHFLEKVPDLVLKRQVKPNPVKLFDGGLYGINDGMQYMIEGKNSGEKVTFRVK